MKVYILDEIDWFIKTNKVVEPNSYNRKNGDKLGEELYQQVHNGVLTDRFYTKFRLETQLNANHIDIVTRTNDGWLNRIKPY